MPVTDTSTPDVDPRATATAHLLHLIKHLTRDGLSARIHVDRHGHPQAIVVNPDAPALSEDVSAAPQEGTWWYWWSWSEKIAPVDEVDAAAARICHVLTPLGRPR